jgi:hypothetical protein
VLDTCGPITIRAPFSTNPWNSSGFLRWNNILMMTVVNYDDEDEDNEDDNDDDNYDEE